MAGVRPKRCGGAGIGAADNDPKTQGAFQVYNIADNQLMGSAPLGAVGVAWQLGGFAAIGSLPPPTDVPPEMGGSTAQLVQAMAGFGGGSGTTDSLNAAPSGPRHHNSRF